VVRFAFFRGQQEKELNFVAETEVQNGMHLIHFKKTTIDLVYPMSADAGDCLKAGKKVLDVEITPNKYYF